MKNKGNIALWTLVAIIILAAILVLGSESKKKSVQINETPPLIEEAVVTETVITEEDISAEVDSIGNDLDSTDVDSLDQGL